MGLLAVELLLMVVLVTAKLLLLVDIVAVKLVLLSNGSFSS